MTLDSERAEELAADVHRIVSRMERYGEVLRRIVAICEENGDPVEIRRIAEDVLVG